MAKKTLFDFLYSAGDAALQAMKKPGREKMIRRAAERVSDELEQKKLDAEIERQKILERLVKTASEDEADSLFRKLADLQIEIGEAENLANSVKAELNVLFGEYTPPVSE